jgi:hypothetical protein
MKHWKFYAIFVFAFLGILVVVDGVIAYPAWLRLGEIVIGIYLCMMAVAAWADYRELVEKQKTKVA